MKKESGSYWERLLKQPGKNIHCKVDWEHWKDEDSEDEFDFGKWCVLEVRRILLYYDGV